MYVGGLGSSRHHSWELKTHNHRSVASFLFCIDCSIHGQSLRLIDERLVRDEAVQHGHRDLWLVHGDHVASPVDLHERQRAVLALLTALLATDLPSLVLRL